MRILPPLGSTLALAAVVGGVCGGLALRPELVPGGFGSPALRPAAATNPAGPGGTPSTAGADRATVTAGMDPVTGRDSPPGYTFDSSLLGVPDVPGPSVQLPELTLRPPSPGTTGQVSTRARSQQFGHTTRWTAQPQVNGPVRRVVRTVADGGYVVVPDEPGDLHLLCGPGSDSYYVDSQDGQWRVYRVDGGSHYDVRYRFVRYDRSPLAASTPCQ